MGWSVQDIPDQTGRVAVVTGANSGLGLETVRALASKGAHVVLACRDLAKGQEAVAEVRREAPTAGLEVRALDLASLASVRAFADALAQAHPRVDLLVNNAGIMAIPRRETADGFEMQFGTNHLGHFALTVRLHGVLEAAPAARVVTVASMAHRGGRIRFDDLMHTRGYARWRVYAQSKLANLLFTLELDRRLRADGATTTAYAAHPGWAATNLQRRGPQHDGSGLLERLSDVGNALFGQSAAEGALPQLFAATAPDVEPGAYYGPERMSGLWGAPRRELPRPQARDAQAAARLWAVSEELTGVAWPPG
ncbi:MAG: SDR family oxidoreductase [Alphaproteobacteria bacterium]|nr:SDR family oxidoreductase [Alphaproteobacteria bacterium]